MNIRNFVNRMAMTLLALLLTAATAGAAQPDNCLDFCMGGAEYIHVQGWAYDPDASSVSIGVHVYVYTDAGCTNQYGDVHVLTANVSRPDVNSAKNITGDHGFSSDITIADAGDYWVKVYAIDTNGDGNPQIGATTAVTVTAGAGTITLTSGTGEVTLQDGDILTGTGGTNTHVMIADGATVTLSDVNITAIPDYSSREWAGITCLGDATITLADGTTNSVKGGRFLYPGIYIPAGHTLTIQGNGSLEAATQDRSGSGLGSGAGIGGISKVECGNIVIKSGNITALGSHRSAGIGGTEGCSCGDITIEGGTVTAIGGYNAAGIGCGYNSSAGNITIAGGTVTATGGDDAAGIGCGRANNVSETVNSSCGDITITGGIVIATGGSNAAGIGCGLGRSYGGNVDYSTCGNITIARTVMSVTATKGNKAQHSIGMGEEYSVCGTVSISGVTGPVSESPYIYEPNGCLTSTIHFDANGGSGTMDDWTFTWDGTAQAFPTCTLTAPEGKIFAGWNTADDGSGTYYAKQVSDIFSVTLYAMWRPQTETVPNGALTLYDGQTLTGTGDRHTHVTIADGATVTLSGVNITSISNSTSHQWAGITCEGNATIILSGENAVTGGYHSAGIFVPQGKTLTIQGDGSLTATGNSYAAGIGSGEDEYCGDIIITGGTVTAFCISNTAAAIGCGKNGSCGNITITDGIQCVSATKISSLNKVNIIGTSGDYSFCGTVTIGDGLDDVTVDKTRYITGPSWTATTSVTLAKEGYGTYYGLFDLVLPVGMKARIVTAFADAGQLTYETIADGSTANNTVPAKTAVMLQTAAADGLQTIDVGITVPTVAAISQTNLLGGSERQKWIPDDGGGTKYYKLTYNQSGTDIGWYWGEDGGASFYSAANKAWLALPPASSSAQSFLGLPDFDEPTGIQTPSDSPLMGRGADGAWYTITGVKLDGKPAAKGIYIHNGRKEVLR